MFLTMSSKLSSDVVKPFSLSSPFCFAPRATGAVTISFFQMGAPGFSTFGAIYRYYSLIISYVMVILGS